MKSALPPDVRRWLRPAVGAFLGGYASLSSGVSQVKGENHIKGAARFNEFDTTAGRSLRLTSGGEADPKGLNYLIGKAKV